MGSFYIALIGEMNVLLYSIGTCVQQWFGLSTVVMRSERSISFNVGLVVGLVNVFTTVL